MILEGLTIRLENSWMNQISKEFQNRLLELVEFQPVNETTWRGILRTAVTGDVQTFTEWMKNHPKLDNVLFLRCERTHCEKDCMRDHGCSISFTCPAPSFAKHLIENSVYMKMPILLENETIYLKVASTDDNLQRFYHDIVKNKQCEVHVIKKFKSEELSKAALTEKQRQFIKVAIDLGYYKVPRKITINELAKRVGVAQSTLGEHLRKAEERIVSSYAT